MKSLAFFALSTIASAAAFAVTPTPQITILGTSDQSVTVNSGSQAHNHAGAQASAIQNLSSNRGYVTINTGSDSKQKTTLSNGADVFNHAWNPGDIAIQNVSSNYGRVELSGGGDSTQTTSMSNSSLSNTARGQGGENCYGVDCKDTAKAMQNVSSNAGNVTVTGKSTQSTTLTSTSVSNTADGAGAVAVQSAASNTGKVDVFGTSKQTVSLTGGTVSNFANGADTTAVQNLASNYDGVEIKKGGSSSQTVTGNGTISNMANGKGSQAFQNLSSNFAKVVIGGTSTQMTSVSGTVMNWADGRGSVAVQNLASNDACEPPKFKLPDCPTGYCWNTASSN